MTEKQKLAEALEPCPFVLWDKVEVITGEGQPDWCNDWHGMQVFVVGIDYNFKKSRYELTVAENMEGQYQTDEMPADNMRLVSRALTPCENEGEEYHLSPREQDVFRKAQRKSVKVMSDPSLESAVKALEALKKPVPEQKGFEKINAWIKATIYNEAIDACIEAIGKRAN